MRAAVEVWKTLRCPGTANDPRMYPSVGMRTTPSPPSSGRFAGVPHSPAESLEGANAQEAAVAWTPAALRFSGECATAELHEWTVAFDRRCSSTNPFGVLVCCADRALRSCGGSLPVARKTNGGRTSRASYYETLGRPGFVA